MFLAVALSALASADTHVRPEQIRNPADVRIYSGDGTPPGTRIPAAQITQPNFVAPAGKFQVSGQDWCDGCTCHSAFVGIEQPGQPTIVHQIFECVTP